VDLHLHDVDFLNHLFGKPHGVESRVVDDGHSFSYIHTRYDYPQADIRAEGGWVKAQVPFTFGYDAIFDEGMLRMKDDVITQYPVEGEAQTVDAGASLRMDSGLNLNNMGPYLAEIAYFVHCVQQGEAPAVITPESAKTSLEITLREVESAKMGKALSM
jgi:predicted dehydrogenase